MLRRLRTSLLLQVEGEAPADRGSLHLTREPAELTAAADKRSDRGLPRCSIDRTGPVSPASPHRSPLTGRSSSVTTPDGRCTGTSARPVISRMGGGRTSLLPP